MNNQANTLVRLTDIVTKSTTGAIILPATASSDAVAAACSLYLGLTKMGKTVALICQNPQNVDLVAADKIQNQFAIAGDSLVISFPYTDGAIDKVDYNIQGESFNLIVSPRAGFAKLNPQQVKYNYAGGVVDFIITIDSPTLNSLGTIYTDNQNQFQGKDIINIDRHLTNSFYGTVNLVEKTVSSISELILKVLQSLRVEIDRDCATNLYAGISQATNNFSSYSVSAGTFENIATLLRLGAVKKTLKKPQSMNSFSQQPPVSWDEPSFEPQLPTVQQTNQPKVNNVPMSTFSGQENKVVKPIEVVEKETQTEEKNPPQDWLKPKIFRGGGGGMV